MRIVTISNNTSRKIILYISVFLLPGAGIQAQDHKSHSELKFESPADFRQYEEKLISDIHWLARTSRDTLAEVRNNKEESMIKWIYNCPYIRVVIEPYVMKLSSKNADLLLSFIFGYTLHNLNVPEDKDPVNANIAGLNMLLNDYSGNRKLMKQDPVVDRLLIIRSSGSLQDYVHPNLSQQK